MQLFSVEQQKSQPLEAHAAAFSTVKVRPGRNSLLATTAAAAAGHGRAGRQAGRRKPWGSLKLVLQAGQQQHAGSRTAIACLLQPAMPHLQLDSKHFTLLEVTAHCNC
jgi:hypothetical protein